MPEVLSCKSCGLGALYKTELMPQYCYTKQITNQLRDLSPRANYTDRETAACWRS
jgi:hypothetical protein